MSLMTISRNIAIALAGATLLGCSTMDSAVNSIANGMNKVSEWTVFEDVKIEKMDTDYFKLETQVNEGLSSFNNRGLRNAAKQSCPVGYVLESQQALNNAALLSSQCEGGNCQHKLVWVIRCKELAEEPFSIFGKT